eukprot:668264-Pelagomonas_calceolata.AAC.5
MLQQEHQHPMTGWQSWDGRLGVSNYAPPPPPFTQTCERIVCQTSNHVELWASSFWQTGE